MTSSLLDGHPLFPGLPTPVHLAASLLGLFAAAGLAILVLARPDRTPSDPPARTRTPSEYLLACGAAAIAVAHAVGGAFVPGRETAVPWLLGGGLLAIAAGLSRSRLAVLAGADPDEPPRGGIRGGRAPGPPALVPLVGVPAEWVPLVAGLLAAVRAAAAGRRACLLGAGLALWGAAQPLGAQQPWLGAAATVAGAVAVASWVWLASAGRLLAKIATAFVATLVAVVVVLAVVVSTLDSSALAREELGLLSSAGAEIADEVSSSWPRQAVDRAGVLARSADTLEHIVEHGDDAGLRSLLDAVVGQDLLAVLDPQGRPLVSVATVDALEQRSFLARLAGSRTVTSLAGGRQEAGEVIKVDGRLVALGGVRVFSGGPVRAEDAPRFLAVTGRIADDVWASRAAGQLPLDVLVEVGGHLSASSGAAAGVPPARLLGAVDGQAGAALTVDGHSLFAASVALTDPETLQPLGRVVVARSGDVLADHQHRQARQLFLVALAGALLAALLSMAISRRLVAPVHRLTAAATAVREGDLDVRADIGSHDELGRLGRTFDAMTASLAEQTVQLRRAADEQSRLRARLEALHTSMSDALVAVDTSGRVLTFNTAAERLLGHDAGDVLGLPLDHVLVGQGPGERTPAQALGDPGGERRSAVRLLLKGSSDHLVPVAATAAPVRGDGGEVLGRVLVLRDVTGEVEIERMKGVFLANVSHELRSPLTPIKGYADILARRDVDDEARRRFASQILDSTGRLERVVGMIVEFAALEGGEMRPDPRPTELAPIVDAVLESWRAREPDRLFASRVERNLGGVLVDEGMLRRCLDELLDNAVKFSPGGEPVTVSAGRVADGDGTGQVQLSVSDRGVGLEVDGVSGLFRDFYQVDAGATRQFGGLGLGLALVQRMVTAMGGGTAVESEPGQGTTFHLRLRADDHAARPGERDEVGS